MKKNFYIFIGTTAELIKIAPVIREMQREKIAFKLIATGQNNIIFEDMEKYIGKIKPDILFIDKNKQSSLAGFAFWTIGTFFSCLFTLRKEFLRKNRKNNFLIVHGDTVSSVIGAVIGKIYGLTVVHIESGLRSFNFLEPFPEEICRYITSRLSSIHFCPNAWAIDNLRGVPGKIINTKQNTLYDSYKISLQDKQLPEILKKLKKKYFVLVVHRQEHVFFQKDKTKRLLSIVLQHVKKDISPVLINLSLTERFLQKTDPRLFKKIKSRSLIVPRLPYSQFMKLIGRSEFVVTDGGSNQEESYYMGKPCLLLRDATERIEGLGKNVVLSKGKKNLMVEFLENYKNYRRNKIDEKLSPSKVIIDYLVNKA